MTATTTKLGADMTDQKTQMREGFEAQRKAGMNVDWFTWQIAWHDALFTVHDIAALARQPAAIDTQGAISVQEAWEAAGGNPGIRATKAELLTALKQLDEVCDAVPSKPAAIGKEAVCIGSVDVVDGRVRSYTFEQTDVPTGSYGLYTSPPDKEASKPAPSVEQDERGAKVATKRVDIQALRAHADKGWGDDCLVPKSVIAMIAEELEASRAASTTAVAQDEREAFRKWYSTHKVTGDVAEAAWMARAASTSVNVAQGAEAVCQTCQGHGMIGGPSYYAPDEGGEPCPDCAPPAQTALTHQLQAEVERLNAIINTPHSDDFLRAVSIEAEHQRQRWGTEGDAGKTPADWFWLVGYLGGKALHAHAANNTEKAEHHIITTAAALANWHGNMFGKTDMRPGIDGDAALTAAQSASGESHADKA